MTTIRPSAVVRFAAAVCATTGVSLALVVPAHAGDVALWACHGPEGQPLGSEPLVSNDSGTGFTMTYGGGCDDDGGVADGGALATFAPAGSAAPPDAAAGWRVVVPTGTTLAGVALDRSTLGFDVPQPGDDLSYTASVPGTVLESASLANGTGLTGAASFSASGDEVDLELSCGAEPGSSCAQPAGSVGLELSSLALTVSDPEPPHVAVGGVDSPVSGPIPLLITASDDGLGLASAAAMVDGQTVATTTFGGANCAPLASGGSVLNLPLDADCPSSVNEVPLTVSTANIPDGKHQLVVTVTDIAGNTTTAVDQTITVLNHLTLPGSTAFLSVGTGGAPTTTTSGSGPGSSGVGPSSTNVPAACPSPRITAVLAGHPLRMSSHGVPVLWQGTRYLFTGRLTCVKNHRLVGVADNTITDIQSVIAERVRVRVRAHGRTRVTTRVEDRVVDRTGAATYRDGLFRVLLHPRSTRTIEFFYGTHTSKTLAKIFVIVTPNAPRSTR